MYNFIPCFHVWHLYHTEPEGAPSSESVMEENSTLKVKLSDAPETGVLELFSQLVELLTSVSSVVELLSQAAQSSLSEEERQVEETASVLQSKLCPVDFSHKQDKVMSTCLLLCCVLHIFPQGCHKEIHSREINKVVLSVL